MKNKQTVYISGRMSGIENMNRERFNLAEDYLKHKGFKVFNPASIEGGDDWTWENYMRECIKWLPYCDYVYLLNGWEKSRGATVEVFVANTLSIPIMYEGEEIE